MQSKAYDSETKAEALTTAELYGTKEAARATGVNVRTFQIWRGEGRTEPEILTLAQQIAARPKAELIVRGSYVLSQIMDKLEGAMENMVPGPYTPGEIKDLTKSAGIWSDKLGAWANLEKKATGGRFGSVVP